MIQRNHEALSRPWMTGFDAMFNEVHFNGTTDYKVARDAIGIFVCQDSEWVVERETELSSCEYSHNHIERYVFGLDYLERFQVVDLAEMSLEAAYMRGAFAAAQALDLQSI